MLNDYSSMFEYSWVKDVYYILGCQREEVYFLQISGIYAFLVDCFSKLEVNFSCSSIETDHEFLAFKNGSEIRQNISNLT